MSYPIYYDQNNIIVRRAFPSDADMLANKLRKSDTNEVWASHNFTPWDAIYSGISNSILSLTITNKGSVVGCFGINAESMLGKKAIIWFLSSDELDKIEYRFLRHSRRFVKMFLALYPFLFNYVDVRNKKSIRWLKYCGAKLDKPQPFGVMNKPFRYFYFQKENK